MLLMSQEGYYDGRANDVWALGIFLVKALATPHPFIDSSNETESEAQAELVRRGEGDFHFPPDQIGAGKASSLVLLMLEHDVSKRITVRHWPDV